jgi:ATP-binding protein involved in chromosome partitioning
MIQSAVRQFLEDVDWSDNGAPLDVLVVDMPPGTGDAQLTLVQKVPLSGAVIVSTPQDIALIDARKGLAMFQRTGVPVLGIVENMSYFCCPQCGSRSEIFGHGGARAEAEKLGVPFLGEIPLHPLIRSLSDAGTPVVVERPDSHEAKPYLEMASMVADVLKQKAAA